MHCCFLPSFRALDLARPRPSARPFTRLKLQQVWPDEGRTNGRSTAHFRQLLHTQHTIAFKRETDTTFRTTYDYFPPHLNCSRSWPRSTLKPKKLATPAKRKHRLTEGGSGINSAVVLRSPACRHGRVDVALLQGLALRRGMLRRGGGDKAQTDQVRICVFKLLPSDSDYWRYILGAYTCRLLA